MTDRKDENQNDKPNKPENSVSDDPKRAPNGGKQAAKGKGRLKLHTGGKSDFEALQHIAETEGEGLRSYYSVTRSGINAGVYFHEAANSKDGTEYMKPPVLLSDPFEIVGRGQSTDEKEYRLLRFKRHGGVEYRTVAMPLEIAGRPDGLAFLRANGIGVNQNGQAIARLVNHIQWEGDQTEYLFSKRGGWCDETFTAYIMPNGEIIGKPETPVSYIGDLSKKRAYGAAGSLEEWQENIGRYLEGNSRLLLAVGAVFAAPLLAIMKHENGGFHFFGQSSIGKSVSGMTALSLIGNPEELKMQWNGTGLSFDNAAAANSDGVIMLDEMGQADGKTLDTAAYAVFNGAKKGQGAKEGGNREHLTWRVLAISNGEYEPEYFMKKYGLQWQAGQAVRLPAIPADAGKGYGVFENLHGFARPDLLAAHLEQSAKTYHGTALRAYLERLTLEAAANKSGLIGRLNALYQAFLARLPSDLASQPIRAAKRFALAAAALEVAGQWGITGVPQSAGADGVKTCFDVWLEHAGTENKEERDILKAAKDFMLEHGYSERFIKDPKKADGSIQYLGDTIETKRNHAGYILESRRTGEPPIWYVLDKVFEDEICKGKDLGLVCRVLADCGWLKKDGRNFKAKVPQSLVGENLLPARIRLYCFRGIAPPEENGAGD